MHLVLNNTDCLLCIFIALLLCCRYNIHAPDQITIHAIKGDIEEIERSEKGTDVIVDEVIQILKLLYIALDIDFFY